MVKTETRIFTIWINKMKKLKEDWKKKYFLFRHLYYSIIIMFNFKGLSKALQIFQSRKCKWNIIIIIRQKSKTLELQVGKMSVYTFR